MPATIPALPTRTTLQEAADGGSGGDSPRRKKNDAGEPLAPTRGRLTEQANIQAAIDRLVAEAPPFSRELCERLAAILGIGAS